jgi:hypothetical protein
LHTFRRRWLCGDGEKTHPEDVGGPKLSPRVRDGFYHELPHPNDRTLAQV